MAGHVLPVEQERSVPSLQKLDVGMETERVADSGVRGVSCRGEQKCSSWVRVTVLTAVAAGPFRPRGFAVHCHPCPGAFLMVTLYNTVNSCNQTHDALKNVYLEPLVKGCVKSRIYPTDMLSRGYTGF